MQSLSPYIFNIKKYISYDLYMNEHFSVEIRKYIFTFVLHAVPNLIKL